MITAQGPRIGSLCSGFGGLEMAVQAVFGGTTVFHADPDPGASKILAHHWPHIPNLGDITTTDWHQVLDQYGPVDIAAMGFPCTDLSLAGLGAGIAPGTRSGLWTHCARAIAALQPRLVVIENVRGLLSAPAHSNLEPCTWCMGDRDDEPVLRALGAVLGDLADLGLDAEWIGLPASDPRIGAAHERWREFIIAWPATENADRPAWCEWRTPAPGQAESRGTRADAGGRGGVPVHPAADLNLLPTPAARDWKSGASNLMDRNSRPLNEVVVNLLPTPNAGNFNDGEALDSWRSRCARNKAKGINGNGQGTPLAIAAQMLAEDGAQDWVTADGTDYRPAIRRWEAVMGRPAPCPTEPGDRGNRRLSPRFTEWHMGLPDGHVTAVPGLSRNAQLHALGNGVVWQQGAVALRLLADRVRASLPAEVAA